MSTAVEQMAHYCKKYAVFCIGANGHGECNTTACWNNKAGVRKVRLIDADALPIDIDYHDVEEAPTLGCWIPCSERLPEASGLYLVTTNAYGVWAARTDSYSVHDKDWKRKGDKKAVITAWMPMPKPYFIKSDGIKEGTDDKI